MCNVDGERAVADALHATLVGVEILDQTEALRRAQERLLAYVLAYGDNNAIEEAECLLDDGFVASGEGVERPGDVNVLINIVKNITIHNITAIGIEFFIISSIGAGASSFCAFAGSSPH